MDGTHIRVREDDKKELEKIMEERGFRTMAELIHWMLYIDTSHNVAYDELEMRVRKLQRRVEELEGKR